MITVISNWSYAIIAIGEVFPLSLLALKTGMKRWLNLLNKGNIIPEIQSRVLRQITEQEVLACLGAAAVLSVTITNSL